MPRFQAGSKAMSTSVCLSWFRSGQAQQLSGQRLAEASSTGTELAQASNGQHVASKGWDLALDLRPGAWYGRTRSIRRDIEERERARRGQHGRQPVLARIPSRRHGAAVRLRA